MTSTAHRSNRVLVIDDEPSIHDAYRKILHPALAGNGSLDAAEAALFGDTGPSAPAVARDFELDVASQGREGVARLREAMTEGRPYRVAFVDMRMPPGWDGVETVENLWKVDPDLEVVICTAYSDIPWDTVVERLGQTHRLLLLRKPFDAAEVWQLADSLSQKRVIEEDARASQAALEAANTTLKAEIRARQTVEGQLKYDSLTELPNRLLLYERLERGIERSKRDSGFNYSVVFLDVDDFKWVNDTFGHAVGDYLLVEVGNRLRSCLRGLDSSLRAVDPLPARLGGDEFVLLLEGVTTAEQMLLAARRLQELMLQPMVIGERAFKISVSLGCVLGTPEHMVPEDALRDADAALYQAKADGKGQIRVFDSSIRQTVVTRQRLRNDLPFAVTRNQLRVLYQPLVSLDSGLLEGFEALARWQHPELGMINPSMFIPIAEESGSICDIGLWVLRESCQQLRIWQQRFPTRQDLSMSVNVSAKQLADPQFIDSLGRVLTEVGLAGKFLNLEITESVFIDRVETVCRQLTAIRRMGVQLHLDDFGTGFSSLSSFHQLPVDAIKIDRSFVANMSLNGHVANIVQAIQQMASNRSLRVIAEGIETREQLSQLQALGCTSGQGYYLSRPVEAVKAQAMLAECTRRFTESVMQWPLSEAA